MGHLSLVVLSTDNFIFGLSRAKSKRPTVLLGSALDAERGWVRRDKPAYCQGMKNVGNMRSM
jgi:hypothetical protein